MSTVFKAGSGRYEWTPSNYGDEHVEWVVNRLHSVLGITRSRAATFGTTQLPCAQPSSISAQATKSLRSCDYLVSPKADGSRYFIMFCTMNNVPLAIAISRSMKLSLLDVDMPPTVFNGTIIDCELMDKDTALSFDLLQLCGEPLRKRTFVYRTQRLATLSCIKLSGVSMTPKQYWPYDDHGIKRTEQVPYASDGYILQHIREHVCVGRSRKSFRVKRCETFDALFIDGEAYMFDRGEKVRVTSSDATFTESKDNGVWECEVVWKRGALVMTPVVERTDKIEPNDRSTLMALQNVVSS